VTPAEIALAFLLREKATTSVIFGSTKPEQVAANLKASDVVLSEQEMQRLDQISALTPDLGGSGSRRARIARQQYL
jgi:aryl-alcohol dehydrogenase-like predicted oxidoreductase